MGKLILLLLLPAMLVGTLAAQPCTVEPRPPKVAIVGAGPSQKTCGNNTVQLNASIPDWMELEWSPANGLYADPHSPSTSFTWPNPVASTTFQTYEHNVRLNIKGIGTNSFNVWETVFTAFFPSNQNAALALLSNGPNNPSFHLDCNDAGFRDYWATVDGPLANPCLISGDNFYPRQNGAYSFKSAIPGCTTHFITAACTATNAANNPPNPNDYCDQYHPRGFIEVQVQPLEVQIASNAFSGGLIKIYNANGTHVGTCGNLSSPFILLPAGIYTLVPQPFGGGYALPPPVDIAVGANTDATVTITYPKASPSGKLSVAHTGDCSNQLWSLGQWSIDGVHFYNAGQTLNEVPVGAHTVTFTDVPGFAAPLPAPLNIEEGKRTVVFGEYQKLPPCGITNFGFSGDLELEMETAEAAACNPANCDRDDYHRYYLEKNLTTTAQATKEQVWALFKSKKSNQAPLTDDFVPIPGSNNYSQGVRTAFSGAFFPEPAWDPGTAILSGESLNLFAPETFALLSGVACVSGNCATWFQNSNSVLLSPLLYTNPVAIYVDEANKCITNYTLEGHILYPGRVSRCIVEECGQIKVKTYGNGLHFFGDNFLGQTMGALNKIIGTEMLFANVDDRFFSLVQQTYPFAPANNGPSPSILPPTLGIENKIWSIKQFKVQHPNLPQTVLFDKYVVADSFWNMGLARYIFHPDGTYDWMDVQNQLGSGTWSNDGINHLTTDGITAELVSVSANEWTAKGFFKTFVDASLVDAEYTFVFERELGCPAQLALAQDPIPPGIHTASDWINLSGKLPSGTGLVVSAPNLLLSPGFTLEAGATLGASTQGCQ